MSKSYLKWRVECHDRFWESIAAFNCEPAALAYARDCSIANRFKPFRYRVMLRDKMLWQSQEYVTREQAS